MFFFSSIFDVWRTIFLDSTSVDVVLSFVRCRHYVRFFLSSFVEISGDMMQTCVCVRHENVVAISSGWSVYVICGWLFIHCPPRNEVMYIAFWINEERKLTLYLFLLSSLLLFENAAMLFIYLLIFPFFSSHFIISLPPTHHSPPFGPSFARFLHYHGRHIIYAITFWWQNLHMTVTVDIRCMHMDVAI